MDLAVLLVGVAMGFIIAFFTIGPGNKPAGPRKPRSREQDAD